MVFGVAGIPTNYKGDFEGLFPWLRTMGLNGFEIQCTYGFKIPNDRRQVIEKNSDFNFSIHGPYYINLGSLNNVVVARSKANLKEGIALAKSLSIERIIFHPGGGHENTPSGRNAAIKQIIRLINEIAAEIDMGNVRLYPEIGGKTASLGSLDEIIEICKNCECCYPCIDIAHLHAREIGSLDSKAKIMEKLARVKKELPNKFDKIHFHAYTINYGEKGEIKHLYHGENMPDGSEGRPNLSEFIEVVKDLKLEPWIISEALDSQELSAQYMLKLYMQK